jgi:hypothetical protein
VRLSIDHPTKGPTQMEIRAQGTLMEQTVRPVL